MNNPELFNRYAIALLELAIEKNETEEFREEVKLIRNIFKEYGEFADLLASVNTELSKKFEIVDKIFKDFKEEIRTFIKIIIRNKRSVYLYQIFKETLFRFDDYLKIEEGKLYLASDMNEADIAKIKKSVEEKEGIHLELTKIIDPSIIGGFIVVIKNNVYDSSVKTKLENLKSSLLGGN